MEDMTFMAKNTQTQQLDLFVAADILSWSPKSDRHSMEHPFFSISKRKDCQIRRYENPDGTWIEITPSVKGLATIWDRDVIIFAISVIRDAMARGATFDRNNQVINITAYNMLAATERGTGGKSYDDLELALDRLKGTIIKTNITPAGGDEKTEGFGLVERYKIVRDKKSRRMLAVELVLSEWLWDAIHSDKDLLSIDREYFSITGGLERRIYELSRKHCGHQRAWQIGMEKLYNKSGSVASPKEFRRMIKEIVKKNILPQYLLQFDLKGDMLTVRNRIIASIGDSKP
jgi:plasmid replication initiation protein